MAEVIDLCSSSAEEEEAPATKRVRLTDSQRAQRREQLRKQGEIETLERLREGLQVQTGSTGSAAPPAAQAQAQAAAKERLGCALFPC